MNKYLVQNDTLYIEGDSLFVEQLKSILHYMDMNDLKEIHIFTGKHVEEPK